MTAKRIEYDPHALAQMFKRGFTHRDVEGLLATGTWSLATTKPGREQRYQREGRVRDWPARVIFLENAERLYVVTVMWVWNRPDTG